MQIARQTLLSAAFGLAVLGSPAESADNLKVPGLWKIVAFQTEDVVTKERTHLYGERPIGFMKLETDGSLSAWLASGWPAKSAQSVWEDVAIPSTRNGPRIARSSILADTGLMGWRSRCTSTGPSTKAGLARTPSTSRGPKGGRVGRKRAVSGSKPIRRNEKYFTSRPRRCATPMGPETPSSGT